MIKGYRFTNQLANAEVDARIHQEFLNRNDGIFYGMELSYTNNSITVSEGLCEIAGRPVAVVGDETIAVSSESLYCLLVLEVDLSKASTKDTFEQAYFKLVTSSSGYPNVTQQEINRIDKTENIYQLEFARFRSGTAGISDFKDTRQFLSYEGLYNEIKKTIESIKNESSVAFKVDIKTGQEVPTNEYIDGKQVFLKRIDCGNLLHTAEKTIAHGINFENKDLVRVNGIASNSKTFYTLPCFRNLKHEDWNVGFYLDATNIHIETFTDKTDFKAYVEIYYVNK